MAQSGSTSLVNRPSAKTAAQTIVAGGPAAPSTFVLPRDEGGAAQRAIASARTQYGAGNTAGNSNLGGGLTRENTDPLTGFSRNAGFTPGGLSSIYAQPGILTDAVLANMGIANSGMSNQLQQTFDPMRVAQFILQGGGTDANAQGSMSDNSTTNWIANAMQQYLTPGGRAPDANQLISTLLGTGQQAQDAAAAKGSYDAASGTMGAAGGGHLSPLAAYLTSNLTPDQQTQAMNSLIGKADFGLNPFMQKATENYAADQAKGYMGQIARGGAGTTNYANYLQGGDLGSWFRTR